MSLHTTEEYLVKAINKSQVSKKPLAALLSTDNNLNWLSTWINKDNAALINRNACISIKIHINDMNSNYQFFKTYIKKLDNYESEVYEEVFGSKKNVLVIIHNKESQCVISDDMDDEDKNELLHALIAEFDDQEEVTPSQKEEKPKIKEDPSSKFRNEYLKAKNDDRLERQRLRKLIELDRLEKSKQNSDIIKEEVVIPDLKDNIKTKDTSKTCKLSIKTPENKNIIHTFDKDSTLDDVRKYLMEDEDIKKEFFFHRNIPRYTYNDMDEFKTLEDLDLLPRSVLLIEYKSGSHIHMKYFDAKPASGGIMGSLMNWWHGGACLHEEEPEKEDKKDDRETYNGNSTNVVDPNK